VELAIAPVVALTRAGILSRRRDREEIMGSFTRRSLLRGSASLITAGVLARPFIANAAAKTASIWIAQGFVPEEDAAFKELVADYQKTSGNTLDYSIVPFAPLRQKEVSAVTGGVVPDMMEWADNVFGPAQAWAGRLEDLSDIVEPQKAQLSKDAVAGVYLYDNVKKNRAYYGIPWKIASVPFHIWMSLIEKAGYKVSEIPDSWSKFIDFFKPMQEKLQAQGMRHTYSYGWEISTVGVDPVNTFNAFMIAHGGKDIFTPDGRAHTTDPRNKAAVIKAMSQLADTLKQGYLPPSAVNWNDADDNNAFHSKLVVIDFDGTLSTELAIIHDKAAYDDVLTHAIPNDDEGKPIPAQVGGPGVVIPKGAKNPDVAKDFLKYSMQPEVLSKYLKGGLGRWAIPLPDFAKSDPFWGHATDPHLKTYFQETLWGPTMPTYEAFSPALAEVNADHVFQIGIADIASNGMAPEEAAEKALKRIDQIFAKYPIEQA
jgi:multiple sugar transport system substrate-binding protein